MAESLGARTVVTVKVQPGGDRGQWDWEVDAERWHGAVGCWLGKGGQGNGSGQGNSSTVGLEDCVPVLWGRQPPSLSPLRTQLNFTVAIDFTASNGECTWCLGGPHNPGAGHGAGVMGTVLQGCHHSPPRCTT